jgi:hypothetical protein
MYLGVQVGGRYHLWRQRFPDGRPEQITFGSTEEAGIAVAPDGRSLITSIITTQNTIWIHDAHGDRAISNEGYADNTPPVFSSDGRRLYYLLRRDSPESPAELTRADLASGKSEVVIPGISIRGYDISNDENQVVYSTQPPGQPSELWIAPLNRSAPPRRISAGGEVSPFFGSNNQVLFRFTEGSVYYLGAMNFDGTGRRKALPLTVLNIDHISPDRRVLILSTELTGTPNREPGAVAVTLEDGRVQKICATDCNVAWSPDERNFYIQIKPPSRDDPAGKTVAIRVPPGKSLPLFPPEAVQNLAEWTKISGVKIVEHANIAPSPSPYIYAYVKPSLHANLFRIPLR